MSFRSIFRAFFSLLLALLLGMGVWAQGGFQPGDAPKPGEPTDAKARKTYASALDWERHRSYDAAISDFRKANKQDGSKCLDCLHNAYRLAVKLGAYKDAVEIGREWITAAQTDADKGIAHFLLGSALLEQSIQSKKHEALAESAQELKLALALDPKRSLVHYRLGSALAWLQQDDAARAEFQKFLDEDRKNPNLHPRAERYLDRIDLARARMVPPFTVTTLDGQRVSMDGLAGKVVLIDFWATWCGPCVRAVPHIRQIAKKFEGQPFVVLSINLDTDENKWREFVDKNNMTWMQAHDTGFNGRIPAQFSVNAIPATFTIDADGVLEDQHVGDAEIEGKIKKLVAQAAAHKPVTPVSENAAEN